MVPSRVRTANATANRWFREHVVLWWLVLATIPGGAYAGIQFLIGDGSAVQALVLGGVFGAIFATVTVVGQRWRSS